MHAPIRVTPTSILVNPKKLVCVTSSETTFPVSILLFVPVVMLTTATNNTIAAIIVIYFEVSLFMLSPSLINGYDIDLLKYIYIYLFNKVVLP